MNTVLIIIAALMLIAAKPLWLSWKKKQKLKVINGLFDFRGEEYFVSADGNTAISINPDIKQICYVDEEDRSHVFKQEDIIEAVMLVDSKRVSTHAGVTIGRFIFAESVHEDKIQSIVMKIRVNDLKKRVPVICFFKSSVAVSTKRGALGKQCRDAISNSEYWHDKLIALSKSIN